MRGQKYFLRRVVFKMFIFKLYLFIYYLVIYVVIELVEYPRGGLKLFRNGQLVKL